MATPVWGLLEKSQTDPETIEQAIARLILAHEQDEESHLGVGESLASHKASVIIDHVVDSIIADKIKAKEITIEKIDWDQQVIQASFESLDGWGQSKIGVGAALTIYGWACRLTTGNVVGDITKIWIEGMMRSVGFSQDPFFQAMVRFDPDMTTEDVAFGIGDWTPWAATDFFGFRWDSDVSKFYVYYFKNGVETNFELAGFDPAVHSVYRAEMSDNGNTLKFYVDGVLVKTFTSAGISMDSDIYICFANRCDEANYNAAMDVSNVIFSQKY